MSGEGKVEDVFNLFSNALGEKLSDHFINMSKPVIKNIKEIIIALVLLLRTSRGWYGRMTLSGIARCMHTKGSIKAKYKRLDRFLTSESFQVNKTALAIFTMIEDKADAAMPAILIDQTDMSGVQVITASIPYQGRALPFALTTFEYENINYSQNKTEKDFFVLLQAALGNTKNSIFIMDRGYAQADYLSFFNETKQLYLIRACHNVMIEYIYRSKPKRVTLGRLRYRQGKPIRYSNVKYHNKQKVPVDVVIYYEKGFKEPWYLIVPPGSEEIMSSSLVVNLYRSRMNIEVKFRDFKSMLGLRGLKLKVSRAEKLARLLVCIALTYIILLLLGCCDLAKQFQKQFEVLRSKKRHGTRKTLSILTVALFMTSDSYLLTLSNLLTLLTSIISSSFFI
jgi:hypothetical protein